MRQRGDDISLDGVTRDHGLFSGVAGRQRYPPLFHTAADTPDKLTYDAFARATGGLYGAFAALAAEAGSTA